jgi:hypothetical protein
VQEVAADAGGIDILFNAIGMEGVQGPSLFEMPGEQYLERLAGSCLLPRLPSTAEVASMASST